MSVSSHLYVYYKLADADQAAARLLAFQVLDAGKPWCDRTALQRRPGLRDSVSTWMETYENVWDIGALEHAINAAAISSGLSARLASPRHAEIFEDIPVSLDFGSIE
jgi:hypothetical protein